MRPRILCLDIEGGYGGSSRSLFESIRHISSDEAELSVWCRRAGPIQSKYEGIQIPCLVTPDMPHISALPRLSRNLYTFGQFALNWPKSADFRQHLATVAPRDFDVVHFNHEGLFLLARWLRGAVGTSPALTMHIRTHLPSTIFSRWQYRTIADYTDQRIYISEMEQANVARITGKNPEGTVIHNIVEQMQSFKPSPDIAKISGFKVASVSNYAWIRGNDRLIEIAEAIKRMGRQDITFVVVGRMDLSGRLPGVLGHLARTGGTLRDYAEHRGVGNMFRFLGHLSDPTPILAACDILARPSRNSDPWGREILEAMALGLPVLTVGTYDRFIEDGVTGILHRTFDAEKMAAAIIELADSELKRENLAKASRDRVARLCQGEARACDLLRVWNTARHCL